MHPTCTEVIRKVVSPLSRLATVDLSVRGIIQSMALPVGAYHFNRTLLSDGVCETIIRIFGKSFILGCWHSICIFTVGVRVLYYVFAELARNTSRKKIKQWSRIIQV